MKKVFKSILLAIVLVFISIVLIGCGSEDAGSLQMKESDMGSSDQSSNIVEEGAMIIYTAEYQVYYQGIDTVIGNVATKLHEVSGFISSSTSSENYAVIIYRVPVAKFEEFIAFIDGQDGVNSKRIETDNVTLTFNELEAKIEALEETKAAFEAILLRDDLTINDIVLIQSKIEQVNAELYKYNLQKDTLQNKVDYTTVKIYYHNEEAPKPEPSAFVEFFKDYGHYLVMFVVLLCKMILYLLPVGVIVGIILVIVLKPFKKKKEKIDNNDIN